MENKMENKNIKIDNKNYQVSSDDQYLTAMGNNFEPHMVQLFRALLGPEDVVADIGANIGLTSLLFSNLTKYVYSFEPSPSTFKILQSNLRLNSTPNVEAVNIGLGHKNEKLSITFAKNNRSGGFVSEKIRPVEGHMTEDIRIGTLDNFFADKKPTPSFLKIDVEGFEQNVIQGGGGFLSNHQPTVVMEMNHFCLDVLQRITIPDFLDFIRSVFPVLYAIDADNKSIVNLHVPDKAYFVMYEHVIQHRFPNLVGGFSREIKLKLDSLNLPVPDILNTSGEIKAKSVPETVSQRERFEGVVTLTNKSGEPWHCNGIHPVLLSYHWLNADGSTYQYDGIRTTLTCETILPDKQFEETVYIIAPEKKGHFQLVLTLVQEGICWFEDKDFRCATVSVIVG